MYTKDGVRPCPLSRTYAYLCPLIDCRNTNTQCQRLTFHSWRAKAAVAASLRVLHSLRRCRKHSHSLRRSARTIGIDRPSRIQAGRQGILQEKHASVVEFRVRVGRTMTLKDTPKKCFSSTNNMAATSCMYSPNWLLQLNPACTFLPFNVRRDAGKKKVATRNTCTTNGSCFVFRVERSVTVKPTQVSHVVRRVLKIAQSKKKKNTTCHCAQKYSRSSSSRIGFVCRRALLGVHINHGIPLRHCMSSCEVPDRVLVLACNTPLSL